MSYSQVKGYVPVTVKNAFTELATKHGLTTSAALRIIMEQIVKDGKLPDYMLTQADKPTATSLFDDDGEFIRKGIDPLGSTLSIS